MAEFELEIIQGTIEAVVFQNYDNGYAVLRLRRDDADTITVVGTIPRPTVGERLMVTGRPKVRWYASTNRSAAAFEDE